MSALGEHLWAVATVLWEEVRGEVGWRKLVREHVERQRRKIAELEASREYLHEVLEERLDRISELSLDVMREIDLRAELEAKLSQRNAEVASLKKRLELHVS